jgi:hypothetical protein
MFLNKKAIALIVLLAVLSAAVASANAISVGVKQGDWIEYSVTSTGTLDEAHSINAARMEVIYVLGDEIQVSIVSTYVNGTQVTTNSTLSLDAGDLIDNFIIPANLTTGMEFNSNTGNMGKMMIGGSREGSYCGATRTVVTTTLNGNTYFWDQATGVSVEGNSEGTLNGQAYTMHSLATATNMWSSQSSGSSSSSTVPVTLLYAAVIVVVVAVAVVVVLVLRRRMY